MDYRGPNFLLSYDLFLFPSPSPHHVRNLDRRNTRRLRKRENLVGREGGEGAKSYNDEKAWFSLGLQAFTCTNIFAAKFGLKCDIKVSLPQCLHWYALYWLCNIYARYIHETLRNPWYKSATQKNGIVHAWSSIQTLVLLIILVIMSPQKGKSLAPTLHIYLLLGLNDWKYHTHSTREYLWKRSRNHGTDPR